MNCAASSFPAEFRDVIFGTIRNDNAAELAERVRKLMKKQASRPRGADGSRECGMQEPGYRSAHPGYACYDYNGDDPLIHLVHLREQR